MYKRLYKIKKLQKGEFHDIEDIILIERPVTIEIEGKPIVTIICLPKDLKELAVGFMYTSGIIDSIKDIKKIEVDLHENKVSVSLDEKNIDKIEGFETELYKRVIKTTCGIPSFWVDLISDSIKRSEESLNDIKISSKTIFKSIAKMQVETKLFRETGGCHGAALFNFQGNILSVCEDIGRHNAIDKVIGSVLLNNIDLKQTFLCSTGRLTGDCVLKVARSKIPILASLSAPIESGIRVAFSHDITLLGFVRGSKMNLYTHPDRIIE